MPTRPKFMELANLAAGLTTSIAAPGANLLFNSSFELGDKGYSAVTLRVDSMAYKGGGGTIDNGAAKFGENSFRLENQSGEGRDNADSVFLTTHDVNVQPGAVYTFSAWVKSEGPGYGCKVKWLSNQIEGKRAPGGGFLPVSGRNDYFGMFKGSVAVKEDRAEKDFPGSTEWRRVTCQFQVKEGHSAYCLGIWLNHKGRLWIDGVQLEEGALTDYSPAAPVEAAVYTADTLTDPEEVEGEVVAISYAGELKAFPLTLTVRDRQLRENLASQTITLWLPAGKAVADNFSFPFQRYGAFNIFSNLQPDTTPRNFRDSLTERVECPSQRKRTFADNSYQSEALFVSLHRPPGRGGPSAFSFLFPDNAERMDGYRMGAHLPEASQTGSGSIRFNDALGALEDRVRLARLAGGVARVWDFQWCHIEPERGRFDWAYNDRLVDEANRQGLNLVAILGASFYPFHDTDWHRAWSVPGWVARGDRLGHPEGNVFTEAATYLPGGKKIRKIVLPRLEDWRGYIRAVASHYKGRVRFYEIMNEPWIVGLSAKYYTEYLRAAYEEIKAADPEAVVVGVCAPSLGSSGGWLRECLAEGAGSCCDAISLHFYNLDQPAVVTRRHAFGALAGRGVDVPLWNSETYCVYASNPAAIEHYETWTPGGVARLHLIDMGEGLQATTALTLNTASVLEPPMNPHQTKWWSDQTIRRPGDVFAALNATNFFLQGATPSGRVEGVDAIGYVFKNRGKLYSAHWSGKDAATLGVTLPDGCSIKVFDVFGNQTGAHEGGARLPLSRQPIYLEWNGADERAITSALGCDFRTTDAKRLRPD